MCMYSMWIKNLFLFLVKLKEKMKQAEDLWEKKEIEQQSELASVRKAHADLKFVLESYQIRTQVEHDVMKERHLQVVKVS